MRKLLNTLYITTPEAYLSKDGENVVVSVNQSEVFRIPIINIEGIVTFGYKGTSPGLMKLCADNRVSITYLSPFGKYIGKFEGPIKGNVLLRTKQWDLSKDKEFSLGISKLFIAGKIQNYRNILCRYIRDNGQNEDVDAAIVYLKRSKERALKINDLDSLRGIEGDAANHYFEIFPNLILNQKSDFIFKGRSKRPPKDAVNAMLSFVYTLIASDVTAALETVGLDPYVGFFHTLRPGRPSLALDLMEELRAYLGDRLVLSLINKRQISIREFISQGEEGIAMTESGRKILLTAWQNRKKETITHPYLEEKIPIGLIPYAQAMLLARYIRNDLDNYPVFLIS
ncbi:MAG: type I-C CRISPR-associated endonuclease Cas1 [Bacteroidales bacterium]|nr:type I-C CRISPR-associated endonuclease Cas1 [Bacteroidales bacterium]